MPRNPDSRDLMAVDWPFFGEVCRALALRVAREYDPEIVLGVAKAGVIPGVGPDASGGARGLRWHDRLPRR